MVDFTDFIAKWEKTGASERANFQPFMIELMALLDVEPAGGSTADKKGDDYAFERPVTNRITGTTNFLDFYRRGSFVMEGKQGSDKKAKPKDILQYELATGEHFPKDQRIGTARRGTAAWVTEMMKARQQAERYARSLESDQGLPPFIIVVDVGYVIELYADFSGQGKYEQFPNKKGHQIYLNDLKDEKVQARLKAIWEAPQSLDGSLYSAKVTREVAIQLAELGKSYAAADYEPETVARFLMRCLFTMFAEDVDLIPKLSFETLLKDCRGNPERVKPLLEELWKTMDSGGFSTALRTDLKRFNGGLFRAEKGGSIKALPVNTVQLSLLILAAEKDWQHVEPSIFGTLLERALSPKDRHKLGAHYTPRPYVERLVGPTIMEPLRADFDAVSAAAISLLEKKNPAGAREVVKEFHHKLCTIRVLDPACGSGNFLYVAMERMKRLEADVLKLLEDLGEKEPRLMLQGETIDPHQFLGLEINEWAVWAAELVLWIGYLQWHFKTFGKAAPSEPVLKDFHNIEKRDALLTWKNTELRRDNSGEVVTRWDKESFIKSTVTGEAIPDPNARVAVHNYCEPKKTVWPNADFIIGNPPFIGRRNIRKFIDPGYIEALSIGYPKIPENADLVMYWWEKAAQLLAKSGAKFGLRRFGFISTNTINQSFNRKVIDIFLSNKKNPIYLKFAIPDHPWVDSADGASVRVAMTVAAKERSIARVTKVISEKVLDTEERYSYDILTEDVLGEINADLSIGSDVSKAKSLASNKKICSVGYQLTGKGFVLSNNEFNSFVANNPSSKFLIKPSVTGSQIQNLSKNLFAIDVCELSIEELQEKYPSIFQHLLDKVKPQRDQNSRKSVRENWWIYGEARNTFRPSLLGVDDVLVTSLTAARRIFDVYPKNIVADSTTVIFSLSDREHLSILSSSIHKVWIDANAGSLGGYKGAIRYNKSLCFDPFPFPDLDNVPLLKERLRGLGEQLRKHRRDRQAKHPKLTLTQMYNVLEKLGANKVLNHQDKIIYNDGHIGILKKIHDGIDAATVLAYGWPEDLSDEETLKRLVALNIERANEEAKGHVRWLRPSYQNPDGTVGKAETSEMDLDEPTVADAMMWPKPLPVQMQLVREALVLAGQASVEDIRSQFKRAQTKTVKERLDTLAALGQAEVLEDGRYAA